MHFREKDSGGSHGYRLVVAIAALSLLISLSQYVALAAPYDGIADRVLGQPNFTSDAANNGALATNARRSGPRGVSIVASAGRTTLLIQIITASSHGRARVRLQTGRRQISSSRTLSA